MSWQNAYMEGKKAAKQMTDEEIMTSSITDIRRYMAKHGLLVISSEKKGDKMIVHSAVDESPIEIWVEPTPDDFDMSLWSGKRELAKWQVDRSRAESPRDFGQLLGWGVDNLCAMVGL